MFKKFEKMVTNVTGNRITVLRTDRGGEYMSDEFKKYLQNLGIKHELTVANSPQQNGVAERMNRTLVESARAMIYHAGLPKSFWAEALYATVYIRNRLPTSAVTGHLTPHENWYGTKPNVKYLRVFGCIAYALSFDGDRKKLDKKAQKYRFVGYSLNSKGYRLFDDQTKKIVVRRDVVFDESCFKYHNRECNPSSNDNSNQFQSDLDNANMDPAGDHGEVQEQASGPEESSRPTRTVKPPTRFGYDEYADVMAETHHAVFSAIEISEPKSFKEAIESEQSAEWKLATDREYASLIKNDTWTLVKLPVGAKAVGCRWVFKVKHKSDGEVDRFKARLVAKGFTQKYGIDYNETFSPVARFASIRAVLAVSLEKKMIVHQMDVETAFLNGVLEEDIYMEQPPGYMQIGCKNLVCKLNKSLYGLKQSPRCWNIVLNDYLLSIGFRRCDADNCIYVRNTDCGLFLIAVYVDDLILASHTLKQMAEVKSCLASRFSMKDMGELHYCLGVSVEQEPANNCMYLHQQQYIRTMLEKYGLSDAKMFSTPCDTSVKMTNRMPRNVIQ